MASRRSSNASRRGVSSSSSGPNVAVIAIGVVAVIILILVFAIDWSGEQPKSGTTTNKGAKVDVPKSEPKPETPDKKPAAPASSKNLKEPSRPAPSIDSKDIVLAEEHYAKATKLNNDARIAQKEGRNQDFSKLINDANDEMERCSAALSKYDAWLDEANMEDWRIPGSYADLQAKMAKYNKLHAGIRRVRPKR